MVFFEVVLFGDGDTVDHVTQIEMATGSLHRKLRWEGEDPGTQLVIGDKVLSPYNRRYLNKDIHGRTTREYFNES